ncbi:MAG TPA: hypothetical protein VFZ52_01740 [Chryseolinea sp.]
MIFESIILFLIAVGLILYTPAFVRRRRGIEKRWPAAFRHIVALIIGWMAFGILLGFFVLLDLMERDQFSVTDFANGVLTPLVIVISGLVLLTLSIATTK